ncbi:hypothetical protein Tco_1330882, partial [Tanacetum coccineum]
MQARGEGIGNVGIGESTSESIRVYDGGDDLHTSGYTCMVPNEGNTNIFNYNYAMLCGVLLLELLHAASGPHE